MKLKLPERSRLQKRFAVTKPDGERPTLVAAAREAIKWATGELKAAGYGFFMAVAWVFHGDLLDHAGADTVKSAIQDYKNRLDMEFTALADACDEAGAE